MHVYMHAYFWQEDVDDSMDEEVPEESDIPADGGDDLDGSDIDGEPYLCVPPVADARPVCGHPEIVEARLRRLQELREEMDRLQSVVMDDDYSKSFCVN